jgi:hypothetical protein
VIWADIELRVAEFWKAVEAGKPPKPDYTRDGDTIAAVIGEPTDTLIDLRAITGPVCSPGISGRQGAREGR